METNSVADDLNVLCQLEIALRNTLAWQNEARRVIAVHSDRGSGISLTLMDATLTDVERLMAVIATFRDMLGADRASPLHEHPHWVVEQHPWGLAVPRSARP